MDLEGIVRRLYPDVEKAKTKLIEEIRFYKGDRYNAEEISNVILTEVMNSMKADSIFGFPKTNIKAGEAGLGSRGIGDNLIHTKLFELTGKQIEEYDDAGIRENIVVSIDGIHSRLSYFPFLAGFYATRATLRDIMVKGAYPLGLIVDIHLSDDSDVGMLIDFEAGVTSIGKALNVPILSGSTLRIGGDLVLGDRISGAVGSIGVLKSKDFLRRRVTKGLKILMTEGNGGGTIATTAIYNGMPDVISETLNIKDLITCIVVRDHLSSNVYSMTDVTNGGIRADALEVSKITNLSFVIDDEKFLSLINPKVRKMLEEINIDPFGISIDSILIFTDNPDLVKERLAQHNIRSEVIGYIDDFRQYPIITYGGKELKPQFRESPYTPIKKYIGNYSPYSIEYISNRLDYAIAEAKTKMDNILKNLKTSFT
ncbi:AIR synthase related protein [Sulfolobus islandicus Y.N.15.51]|uniref:AIR synthase related protein n=1 Tax=Saccharolobus islandicus (strain Y.N.15.51 / Yellowstone \|nr:AIR synthase related protein [Sulfolobus islandicus]ACP47874.1 AIR synthase related protein [Sulfolobus islandicus Y.N.15.51]